MDLTEAQSLLMILRMIFARYRIGTCRAALCLLIFILFSILPAFAKTWDTKGAERAFEEARKKRSEISQTSQPSVNQYLECAKTYRKVHIKDPHYMRTGDAIYEEGLVYQEMGDRFADLEFYRTAVKRFNLLLRDYGGNRNCPDALLRMGNIYSLQLNNVDAAREAFQRIRANYRNSAAFSQLAPANTDSKPLSMQADLPTAPALDVRSAEKTSVQNIRYWSTGEYVRVVIDMDLDTQYRKGFLSDPHRIYFDISNSKLSADLKSRTFTVDDELLKQIRIAPNRPDVVRVVLDLSEPRNYSAFELNNPFRIVIDLQRKAVAAAQHKRLSLEPDARSDQTSHNLPTKQTPGRLGEAKQTPESLVPTEAKKQTSNAKIAGTPVNQPPQLAAKGEASVRKDVKPLPVPHSGPTEIKPSAGPSIAGGTETSTKSEAKQPSLLAENKEFKTKPFPFAVTELEPAAQDEAKRKAAMPIETKAAKTSIERDKVPEIGIKLPAPITPVPSGIPRVAPPTSNGDRTLTRVLGLKVGRIVIDPGHGGHDWGSIGPGGLLEKDLVLSLAFELRRLLEEKLGAEVVLTRTDDSFVSLEERTAIANRHRADLFVSIHANSSRSRSTSGIETYYLDFAATEAEREVAARENAASLNSVYDLENLVKKIAQADKSMESRELASIIQKKLYAGTKKLFPTAKNRGVRKAPFIVLIGANMPSVLVEVAFLSNPKDERLLSNAANRNILTAALYSGIEDYIKTLGVEVVHNQPSQR